MEDARALADRMVRDALMRGGSPEAFPQNAMAQPPPAQHYPDPAQAQMWAKAYSTAFARANPPQPRMDAIPPDFMAQGMPNMSVYMKRPTVDPSLAPYPPPHGGLTPRALEHLARGGGVTTAFPYSQGAQPLRCPKCSRVFLRKSLAQKHNNRCQGRVPRKRGAAVISSSTAGSDATRWSGEVAPDTVLATPISLPLAGAEPVGMQRELNSPQTSTEPPPPATPPLSTAEIEHVVDTIDLADVMSFLA